MGPMHWIRGWGLAYGVCPWGIALVMGDLMEDILGWVVDGFSLGPLSGGGGGGEEETPGHVLLSRFRRTTRVSESSVFICNWITLHAPLRRNTEEKRQGKELKVL